MHQYISIQIREVNLFVTPRQGHARQSGRHTLGEEGV